MKLKPYIERLRKSIHDNHHEFESYWPFELQIGFIDDYIDSEDKSDLEKVFFLLLHQFPSDHKNYIVRPNQMILVPDVYDLKVPGVEYEIDFALFGGSIINPVKVAIECDGIRSHGLKHKRRDRRKEVNLQADGWIVMRFDSREIQEELKKFDEKGYISDFLESIENTINEKLKIINDHTFANEEYKSKLTGYKWGNIECPNCHQPQSVILNHKRHKCYHCKETFIREIKADEKIKFDYKGILYFSE